MTTVLDTTTVPGVRFLYRLAVLLAVISGAFCIAGCLVLAVNYHGVFSYSRMNADGQNDSTQNNTDSINATAPLPLSSDPTYRQPPADSFNRLPTDEPSFLALRQALAQNTQDEDLKTQIRELDQRLRADFFKRRAIATRSAYLLLFSSVLFFVALRTTSVLKRQIPSPDEIKRQNERRNSNNSWTFTAVIAWLMLCAGLFLGLLFTPEPDIEGMFIAKLTPPAVSTSNQNTGQTTSSNTTLVNTTTAPLPEIKLTEEILVKNWVSFRNFDGNGIGFSDAPPTQWNGKTGENILWKTEVPLPGHSSPVIWENKLFLSGADENTQKIFCYDVNGGTLLWECDVTRPEAKVGEVSEDTGYAAPTCVTDGRHVYAMFANGELVAVDINGNFVWRHSFGIPNNSYGFASSPALYFDKLVVQFDNADGEDGTSKLVAFDLMTGKIIWEVSRDMPTSWASPTIKKIGDSYQIITCANPFVIAYHPDDGKEIWRCRCLGGDVGPSAISFGNTVLVTNMMPRTSAIDATGTGDVTETHILWSGDSALPDTVSPFAADDYFFTLDSGGYLTGFDPKVIASNKRARSWELELGYPVNVYSSPIKVGQYVYIFDKTEEAEGTEGEAKAFVIDLSKIALDDEGQLTEEAAKAMILSTNPMPEPCVTSPAVLNNRLYIRSLTTLYCIQ